jgi:hypothetical protein
VLSNFLKLFGVKSVADLSHEAIDALRVELEDAAGMHLELIEEKRATLARAAKPAPVYAADGSLAVGK